MLYDSVVTLWGAKTRKDFMAGHSKHKVPLIMKSMQMCTAGTRFGLGGGGGGGGGPITPAQHYGQ